MAFPIAILLILLVPFFLIAVFAVIFFGLLKVRKASSAPPTPMEELKDMAKLQGPLKEELEQAAAKADNNIGSDDILDNLGDIGVLWTNDSFSRTSWGASKSTSYFHSGHSPFKPFEPVLANVETRTSASVGIKDPWAMTRGIMAAKSSNMDLRVLLQEGVAYVHLDGKFIGKADLKAGTIADAIGKKVGSFSAPLAPLVKIGPIRPTVRMPVSVKGKNACDIVLFVGGIGPLSGTLKGSVIFEDLDKKLPRNTRALILALYLALESVKLQQTGSGFTGRA
jgi:hypothetical protein